MPIVPDAGHIAARIVQVLEGTHRLREASTAKAVQRALGLAVQGETAKSLAGLEYAQRLSPTDGGISYAIGLMRMALGDPRASEPLELLAARTGWFDVRIHLALARQMFVNIGQAAAELALALSTNAPGSEPLFLQLAEEVARETGAPGWCGLDNRGRLTLGGPVSRAARPDVAILIDGRRARARLLPKPGPGDTRRLLLLEPSWAKAHRIEAFSNGRGLIGSPIDVAQVTRVDGFVAATPAGGLDGWCWLPGERTLPPDIAVASAAQPEHAITLTAQARRADLRGFSEFAMPRRFAAAWPALQGLEGPLRVHGPHGRELHGSPLDPRGAIDSARAAATSITRLFPATTRADLGTSAAGYEPSIPTRLQPPPPSHGMADPARGVDIVIPVYRGLQTTLACLGSVLAARGACQRVVVVSDASPDAELMAALRDIAAGGAIVLLEQPINRGFPATANVGLRHADGRDVVLLNSDTIVAPRWLERLRGIVHAAEDIGTATPLSNDATIFGYPTPNSPGEAPDLEATALLSDLAWQANGATTRDVPTGHGFCLFVRAECLADTGVLREDVFAQGYGEENDFCLRARVFGWRHVAAAGVFVTHVGGQSFGATRGFLIERNLEILNRLHGGYDRLIRDWVRDDPLAGSRRQLDRARFLAEANGRRAVLLVSHNRGGGVLRHVRERAALHEAAGDRAIILRPRDGTEPQGACRIETMQQGRFPNLWFAMPDELEALLGFLREARVRFIEVHHFIGHHPALLPALRALGCGYDVMIHDYAWFCARIMLITGNDRYCGEPPIAACANCIADNGGRIDEDIAPRRLVERSQALLKGARAIVAPSMDTARRIERHFPVEVDVGMWEREPAPRLRAPPRDGGARRICVVGGIGVEKGFDVLLGVARRAAAQDLPLEFCVVGFTCDDQRLLDTGRVSITGRYEEHEAGELIAAQKADFAFVPSIWPETWSYVLSQVWRAGLPVLAFDIGAPAERIRALRGGILLPLHLSPAKLADVLLDPTLFDALFAS